MQLRTGFSQHQLLYGILQAGVGVGQALQQFEERACPDGCLLRSCHTHGIDPPLDPSCSKLRHSLTLPPCTCLFTTLPDPALAIAMSCHMHLHILLPLEASCHAFSAFSEFPITTLSGRIQTSRSPQSSRNCSFCSAFYAEFVRTKRYRVGSLPSLNRLILLKQNAILVRTKLLLLISFHHIIVNI